jgi:glycosyltransferase involved in cell wall biosynthesis
MTTISTCLITKNEENYIENLLRSIKNISDEIIIVDTGSTDKTMEISRKYTNKIFSIKWEDDFSKARNESIKYASSDWILYLDADEILDYESSKKIKKYLSLLDNKPYIIVGNIILPDKTSFIRTVLFRNNYNIKFREKIHEQLEGENPIYAYCPIIKVYVTRYEDLSTIKEKTKKYYELLEKSLENEKHPLRLAYKYRCLANSCDDEKKIKNYFNICINIINENSDEFDEFSRQGILSEYIEFLIKIKDYHKALDVSKELITLYPKNYIAGYYMALCLIRLEKINDAFDILQSELNNINNLETYFMDKKHLKALINIELARIELIKDNYDNYYSHLLIAKDLYSFNEIDLYLFSYLLIKEDLKNSIQYIHSISNSEDINKLIVVSENYKDERIYYQYIIKLLNEVKKLNYLFIDKEIWLIENKIIELEHKVKNINNQLSSIKNNLPRIKIIVKVLDNSLISLENINKLKYISHDITFISKNSLINKDLNIIQFEYTNDLDIINNIPRDSEIEYLMLINSYEQISENTILKLPQIFKNNDNDILYTKVINVNLDESKSFYYFKEIFFKNKKYLPNLPNQKDKSYKKILVYDLSSFFSEFKKILLKDLKNLENISTNSELEKIINYKLFADNYSYFLNNYNKAIEFYSKAIDLYKSEKFDNTNNFYIELLLGIIRSNILLENIFFNKELIEETIDLVPTISDILYFLSKYHDIKGNIKKSIEVLKYLENLFESKSVLNISKISSFEQSIRVTVFIELSKLYKKENNYFLAESYLKKAIIQSPNSMYVNLQLCKFYLFDNNLEKSFNYLINSRFITLNEKQKLILKTYLSEDKNSENYIELYKFILSNLLKYTYWDKYEKLELRDKEFSFL